MGAFYYSISQRFVGLFLTSLVFCTFSLLPLGLLYSDSIMLTMFLKSLMIRAICFKTRCSSLTESFVWGQRSQPLGLPLSPQDAWLLSADPSPGWGGLPSGAIWLKRRFLQPLACDGTGTGPGLRLPLGF